jgi:hypothetical protein
MHKQMNGISPYVPCTHSVMQASFRFLHSFGSGSTSWLRYLTSFENGPIVIVPLPSFRWGMK